MFGWESHCWVSLLSASTFRRLVPFRFTPQQMIPVVAQNRPNVARAVSTPDAIYPINSWPVDLSQRRKSSLVLTSLSTSRRGHQRFTCVHLLHLHLPVLTPTFPQLLTTLAFDQSRIGWFGTRHCKPIPEGLPPSISHVQTQLLVYLPPFLDAACYGTHFLRSQLNANRF